MVLSPQRCAADSISIPIRSRTGKPHYTQIIIIFFQVAKKPTKSEKEFRVSTVYGLLCDGHSRTQIVQFSAENWDVGERTADNYIADARVRIESDCSLSRQAFLAEALVRLRNYEQQAAKRGQLQVATNSVRLQAELTGIGKAL